ncbi:MAG: stage II sporulation protein R [Clostridiales bacterium]|nr:stage II sporulation protein R [Candidatus Cacconaster stercorequi]
MRKDVYKPMEIALLLALAVTLLWGSWSLQRQDALAQKMIRLHVIANSDSAADQALKLQVRDKVLDFTTSVLQSSKDMEDAKQRLDGALPQIQRLAGGEIEEQGYHYTVSARLEESEFPLKEYDGFSLPGGKYLALRIVIGEGGGHNWWCVVYPPLCTAAAADLKETAVAAGLGEDDLALITEEDTGYVLRFRSLELWESLRQWLQK